MKKRFYLFPLLFSSGFLLLILAIFLQYATAPLQAQQPTPTVVVSHLPPNQPERGLIYDGLELATDGLCQGLYRLIGMSECTHGPDAPPFGFDVKRPVPLIDTGTFQPNADPIQCDGDGTSGKRIQVLFARASDVTDRFNSVKNTIQQAAIDADTIFKISAAETGGYRRIRFVHDNGCNLTIPPVTMVITGDDSFSNTINELKRLGYNSSSRKYMVFVDANVYCGIANIFNDDSGGSGNWSNTGPQYERMDNGCWTGTAAAHELMHNLGGVQRSAPHSTFLQNQASGNTWHCSDENDVMCYADASGVVMTYDCPDAVHNGLFDCHHDDYYNTAPLSGSYLATHWNTVNNQFLIVGTIPQRIFIPLLLHP